MLRFIILILVGLGSGCQTVPAGRSSVASDRASGKAADPKGLPPPEASILGYCAGEPLTWRDLAPSLIELSGGQAISEYVMDIGLRQRLQRRSHAITDADTTRERALFADVIAKDRHESERLLREVRRRQHLGEVRFRQMLWRNAALRSLVQEQIEVPDALARKTYDFEHGTKYSARLLVVPDVGAAGRLVQAARQGASFVDLVMEHSTDSSRQKGGVLRPISLVDPTWPDGIRSTLASMQVGAISDPVMVDGGYAVLRLEAIQPASGIAYESVKDEMTRRSRLGVEHDAMDRLAREIIRSADVIVMHRALNETWERQRDGMLAEAR